MRLCPRHLQILVNHLADMPPLKLNGTFLITTDSAWLSALTSLRIQRWRLLDRYINQTCYLLPIKFNSILHKGISLLFEREFSMHPFWIVRCIVKFRATNMVHISQRQPKSNFKNTKNTHHLCSKTHYQVDTNVVNALSCMCHCVLFLWNNFEPNVCAQHFLHLVVILLSLSISQYGG